MNVLADTERVDKEVAVVQGLKEPEALNTDESLKIPDCEIVRATIIDTD